MSALPGFVRSKTGQRAIAATVLSTAFTIFNFLTYGTTAVVARASGAGQHDRAARPDPAHTDLALDLHADHRPIAFPNETLGRSRQTQLDLSPLGDILRYDLE